MTYKCNPKLAGSGLLGAIPQTGTCPNKCPDCFFQSGRSYLEPLADNLPNMPSPAEAAGRVVRVNDGHDSNVDREATIAACAGYPAKFYNTAIPTDLEGFDAPVVLTLNPAGMTDRRFHHLDKPPANLMFVRFRTNTWNRPLADAAIEYYTAREVPVVLTFLAYFDARVPTGHQCNYTFRKRTLNSYWAIRTDAWRHMMLPHLENPWVHSCGRVEGERGVTACRHCGNCLREYYATMERLRA